LSLPVGAFDALAGAASAPPQNPEPAVVAPPEETLANPAPFSQAAAEGANDLAENNPTPNRPSSWARALMGGVVDALAGAGAGGKVPPGAGALYGAGAAARQIQGRRDQQQQQAFENQRQMRQMSREEAIARATIAHENAATAHDEALTANLSQENQAKAIETGKAALEPYLSAGAPILAQGITSDEVAQLVKQKKLDPTQQHGFPSGQMPVLGPDGMPIKDKLGNPVMRNTYTVVGDAPQVTLDEKNSQLISENTPYKLPPGSKMSGIVYGTLVQRAKSAQTAQMVIDAQLEESGLHKSALDESVAANKMKPDWGAALAKAKGDVAVAMTDKALLAKYPNAQALVANLYGGQKEFETIRHDQAEEKAKEVEEARKEREDAQKKLAQQDYTGDPNATDPVSFRASLEPNAQAVVDLIGQGRAPLHNPSYLLARKPEIMGAVEKAYPGFDASKVESYQKTYQDFTSGKTSIALNAGGTALEHLSELRALNTLKSRIPGTDDYARYHNKVNTVAPELARFYGNDTDIGIKSLKATLDSTLFPRDAAITEQAKSMGDKLDNYEQQWQNAAPSKAYQAPMPVISDAAKQARAKLDPEYARKFAPGVSGAMPTATGPNGQKIQWNGTAWLPLRPQ